MRRPWLFGGTWFFSSLSSLRNMGPVVDLRDTHPSKTFHPWNFPGIGHPWQAYPIVWTGEAEIFPARGFSGKIIARLFLCCFFLWGIFQPQVFAAPNAKDFNQEKARIFLEKAAKAQLKGEIEDAIMALDDAYDAFPTDKLPLLLKGEVLCHFGLYRRATGTLSDINVSDFTPEQQVRFHLVSARVALCEGKLEEGAVSLGAVLKINPKSPEALVRLAFIHEHFGARQRTLQLLEALDNPDLLDFKDRSLLFALHLFLGDWGPSLYMAEGLGQKLEKVEFGEEGTPFLFGLWQNSLTIMLSQIYLTFGNMFGGLYLIFLLGLLALLASHLTPETGLFRDVGFVVLTLLHLVGGWYLGAKGFGIAILQDYFVISDPAWIIPRLLSAMHMVTLGFFLIFPIFRLLPEVLRPRRVELYSSWFFCFWFMASVLIFQSRMPWVQQGPFLLGGLALSAFFAAFMPLGPYLLFLIASQLGLSRFVPSSGSASGPESVLTFAEAKIQEAVALRNFERDDFDSPVQIAKKIFSSLEKKTLPDLWLTLVKAYIEWEDFFEAEAHLKGYLKVFESGAQQEAGLLISALLKSLKGDHSGALGIIQGIPEARARVFSAESSALSLYILGRCNRNLNESVQAHIDLTTALSMAEGKLLRARILIELTEMDVKMNRLEWGQKWLSAAKKLKNGPKTASGVKVVEALVLLGQKKTEEALKTAQEGCRLFPKFSRAWWCQGHILCCLSRQSEAEKLLERMTAGMDDADRLMREVTERQG